MTDPYTPTTEEVIERCGVDVPDTLRYLDEIEDEYWDREQVAHTLWTMGAWLDHKKCSNNPEKGNADASYENGCEVCQKYLLAVADSIVLIRALPVPSTGTEKPAVTALFALHGLDATGTKAVPEPTGDPQPQEPRIIRYLNPESNLIGAAVRNEWGWWVVGRPEPVTEEWLLAHFVEVTELVPTPTESGDNRV